MYSLHCIAFCSVVFTLKGQLLAESEERFRDFCSAVTTFSLVLF